MNSVSINRDEILRILKYDLVILPALIPNGYVLFSYNRVLNLSDKNVVLELQDPSVTPQWLILKRYRSLLAELDKRHVKYHISTDDDSAGDIWAFEGFPGNGKQIYRLMKSSMLWALTANHNVQLPSRLSNMILNIPDYNDMGALVDRTLAIGDYLTSRKWRS